MAINPGALLEAISDALAVARITLVSKSPAVLAGVCGVMLNLRLAITPVARGVLFNE